MKQISVELTVKKPVYINRRKVQMMVSNREAKILQEQLMKDFCETNRNSFEIEDKLSFEDVCICLGAGNKDFFERLNDESLNYIGDGCFCKKRCMLAEDQYYND